MRKPRWVETPDGSGFSLERQGSLIIELAPVAPGSGSNVGARSYSWDKKQVRLAAALMGAPFAPDEDAQTPLSITGPYIKGPHARSPGSACTVPDASISHTCRTERFC